MATSTSAASDASRAEPPAPGVVAREEILTSLAAQIVATDELIGLAQESIRVFDRDLSTTGWSTRARADNLFSFLRRARRGRIDIIVHDTRWIESSCPRVVTLLRRYGHAITIYRTSLDARSAMDPLMIVDDRHFLHRFHADRSRAALGIEQPQAARPLVNRFDEIWATGEQGLSGTTLGL